MIEQRQFYINGQWVDPLVPHDFNIINPATEKPVAVISLGSQKDVDLAVQAARDAFDDFSMWSVDERIALIEKIQIEYEKRITRMGELISLEMGAAISFSHEAQAASGTGHIEATLEALKSYAFEYRSPRGGSLITEEAIGVCGLITPWNWPINQITSKVIPALAAGCTCVLKPSEMTPLSGHLFAEILHDAGVPKGVFNLINGNGPDVGSALTSHPDVDMVSFTGSTRAGIAISKSVADTIKRVTLELGGKSPNIIFADADLDHAVRWSVEACFGNAGQSCDAPTRLLVQRDVYDKALEIAQNAAQGTDVGNPALEGNHMGPVSSKIQFDKIQALIEKGQKEARLITGGAGRPDGMERGYFVKPTIFADVTNDMTVAQEEIFGPVLAILPFDTEEEAIKIANETPYGLAGYLHTSDKARANRVARRIRAGHISINGEAQDYDVPFGGFKQSGNGREYGVYGLRDYLEIKAITGFGF